MPDGKWGTVISAFVVRREQEQPNDGIDALCCVGYDKALQRLNAI